MLRVFLAENTILAKLEVWNSAAWETQYKLFSESGKFKVRRLGWGMRPTSLEGSRAWGQQGIAGSAVTWVGLNCSENVPMMVCTIHSWGQKTRD